MLLSGMAMAPAEDEQRKRSNTPSRGRARGFDALLLPSSGRKESLPNYTDAFGVRWANTQSPEATASTLIRSIGGYLFLFAMLSMRCAYLCTRMSGDLMPLPMLPCLPRPTCIGKTPSLALESAGDVNQFIAANGCRMLHAALASMPNAVAGTVPSVLHRASYQVYTSPACMCTP